MNPYGDGSGGALNVTGTTSLPLNTKHQYTTVNVASGATLTTASATGAVLYICATESITINGTINVSNKVNYGNASWSTTIDGVTYTSPGVGAGGSGGSNVPSQRQPNGFGGGASNSSSSGTIPGGASPLGGGGGTVSRNTAGTSNIPRELGQSSGGSSGIGSVSIGAGGPAGAAYATAIAGSGGGTHGADGTNGSGSGGNAPGWSGGWYWQALGGGGAGGRAGRAGVHVVLKAPIVIFNGSIITSGTNGGNGGNGGRGRSSDGWMTGAVAYGFGGGGGGGGNGGSIELVYSSLDNNGNANTSGGSGGSGGAGGAPAGQPFRFIAGSGVGGSTGQLTTTQLAPYTQFTANKTSGSRPLTVAFTNQSLGATSYSWNFGDSSGSSQTNPTHVYSAPGTYTVTLTATNAAGSDTMTRTSYITVTVASFDRAISGTLKFSGVASRSLTAYRSISGTLMFGGSVRAVILRDAEALQDKTYLYKVYDPDGNYIETWRDVISDLNFTHEINTIGSTTSIELARNSDSVGQTVAPLQDESGVNLLTEDDQTILVATETRNQIGSGSSVDYNNRVDITAFYGSVEPLYTESMEEILTEDDEQIFADLGAPNGLRVFTGFISEINSRYGNSETTIVQLTSYGYDLDQFPITTAYNNNTTTVPFNSYDPSDIVRTAVDRFVQTAAQEQVSYTMRTSTSIDTSGTVVSYTFRNNTYKEVLDKTLELLPSNWYYRVGLGDNTVYVRERSATPQHLFYLGKHIKALDLKGSILDVVNHTLFTGGGDPALYIERKEAPAQRTRRGLEVMADSRVTLESSAGIISEGAIEEKNKLQYRTTVEILTKQYDIESIAVGETVGFRNFNNSVDSLVMQVVGLAYTPDLVQLQLETKPLTINKRLSDIQRNLTVSENAQTPATPS